MMINFLVMGFERWGIGGLQGGLEGTVKMAGLKLSYLCIFGWKMCVSYQNQLYFLVNYRASREVHMEEWNACKAADLPNQPSWSMEWLLRQPDYSQIQLDGLEAQSCWLCGLEFIWFCAINALWTNERLVQLLIHSPQLLLFSGFAEF